MAPGVGGYDEGRVLCVLSARKVGVRCALDGVDVIDETDGAILYRGSLVGHRLKTSGMVDAGGHTRSLVRDIARVGLAVDGDFAEVSVCSHLGGERDKEEGENVIK